MFLTCGHFGVKQPDGSWKCKHGTQHRCNMWGCERCKEKKRDNISNAHTKEYCFARMTRKQIKNWVSKYESAPTKQS